VVCATASREGSSGAADRKQEHGKAKQKSGTLVGVCLLSSFASASTIAAETLAFRREQHSA
jgi:hypothetical protein